MLVKNSCVQGLFEEALRRLPTKDRPQIYAAIEQSISKLGSEILRLTNLGQKGWGNLDRIKSLDEQIQYLEEVLAAFERDAKNL